MIIEHTRTNHIHNPMGYLMEKPVFSYKVTGAKGKRQKYGRIRVAKDSDMRGIVYDSSEREDMDSIAFCADMQLEPYTRYYWTVEAASDAGEKVISDVSWFETGKMQEAWEGKWIFSELNEGTHPIFFCNRDIKKEVQNARMYISGLGLYEAYINGEKVSDEYLTPYCNNYDQWIQYQTYDVTDMMKTGNISIEVLLGNGWYKGRFGLDEDGTTEKLYGDTFLLIAEIHLEYGDGSKEIITTDESWKARKSPILESSFYNGEVYDASFADETVYPVRIWENPIAPLSERLSLPIKVKEILKPTRVIHTPKEELVLDLGQNHSGWFQLKIREDKGKKVTLYFGEELQDGCFYNGNLRTGKQEYTYIADGREQVIRPHFTSYGYRYVKLEGFEHFEENDYLGWVLYSDLEETGWIKTGNPLVDKLAENSMWSQKSNFLDIPMDCPQRDERMGWTGDAQVFAPAACFNMDTYAFYRKFLFDMYEEQKSRNGAVPFTIPACGQNSSCGVWGDAATIIPFAVYQYFGDKSILKEQYESMKAWVNYIRDANGDDWNWRKRFTFGDWLALDSHNEKMPTGGTDTGYLATIYYYHSTVLVAQAARILENNDEAEVFEKRANDLLLEIQQEYFSPNGRLCVDTQTGYLTALKFNIAKDKERIKEALRESFKRNEDKLETGFVGTSMMCDVLSSNGMNDLAYSLLLNEECPGWLYSVKKGATTIWERWDSLDDSGHFSTSGLNSLNHYSYGAIVEWMFKHSAGISPRLTAPGFREIDLQPKPDYRLGKMDAKYDSPIGIYRSAWEVTETHGLRVNVEVPFGGRAYLRLPFAPESVYENKGNPIFAKVLKEDGYCCILEAGSYEVEYKTTTPMKAELGVHSPIAELMAQDKTKEVIVELLPMITMLPQSMYDRSLLEMLNMGKKTIEPSQIDEINKLLNKAYA